MSKFLVVLIAVSTMLLGVAGCGEKDNMTGGPQVYYLNFKPEQDKEWQNLAKAYTEETGVSVTVLTAASGTYESTLKSEIGKSNPPTLFQVNGPVGLSGWENYCYDLTDSEVYNLLSSKDFALSTDDEVLAVAYVVESYGIIYNKKLLEQAGYSEDYIVNFETLKEVVEDITRREDELGFAAFTSAGMDSSSDWRFKSHLANLPLYYEYLADGIDSSTAVSGVYLDGFKDIWDLYINNATTSKALISTKTGQDAIGEFVLEEAVFYQNGTWAYGDIVQVGEENLGILPIYIGVDGEENQGLCTGTENYWCVNKNAKQADIDATLDFMLWCVTSDVGVDVMCDDMGFTIPFVTNKPSSNPLVNIANRYIDDGKVPVVWSFTTIPSDQWKNNLGSVLTGYAAGNIMWEAVEKVFVQGWADEYSIVNN